MTEKRYQIFISSTFEDLKDIRQRAIAEILKLGHIPIGMEMFNPDDREQWIQIKKNIDHSDYYLIIVAKRYGTITKRGISYTEKEYNYAVRMRIPIIRLLIDDNARLESWKIENDAQKMDKLIAFTKKLRKLPSAFWIDEGDFAAKLVSAINYYITEYPRVGWLKANAMVDPMKADTLKLNDYVDTQLAQIRNSLDVGLYYDYYNRKVELTINSKDNTLEILVTNELFVKNIYNHSNIYSPCPVFETKSQADSYKHIEFMINRVSRMDIIQKDVIQRTSDRQLRFAVNNIFDYSEYKTYHELHIFHKYSYVRENMAFFMHNQLRVPCKEYSVSVHLNNDINNEYKVLSFAFSHYQHSMSNNWKSEISSDEHSSNILLSEWAAPGSGFNTILVKK